MATRTIFVVGNGIPKEAKASGAITPGHLVEITSAAVDTVLVHATAGGSVVARLFAVEDDLQGKDIDDAYATGTNVLYRAAEPGEEVNALIQNGQNIAKGDLLESAGDGTLRLHVPDSEAASNVGSAIVGKAQEASDMSDSSSVDPSGRCRVEVN